MNDDVFAESLTTQKLIKITGVKDLLLVEELKLKIDSRSECGIGNIGKWIPNLKYLKLNNSFIPTIRDLGTGFNHLTSLWMARCNLSELEGLGSLISLKELYVAFNQLQTLDPISMLENLEILDLEGNLISDPIQIEYLVFCSNLKSLTILDNPINFDQVLQGAETADADIRNRHIVSTLIPQLEILDDIPLGIDKIKTSQEPIQTNPIHDDSKVETQDSIQAPKPNSPIEPLISRRPMSCAMIKRPTPPSRVDSSIISQKQIAMLRERVQARLAGDTKKQIIINIPETDKSPKRITRIPMPPIKNKNASDLSPVPPSTRRTQSLRYHSRVLTSS